MHFYLKVVDQGSSDKNEVNMFQDHKNVFKNEKVTEGEWRLKNLKTAVLSFMNHIPNILIYDAWS